MNITPVLNCSYSITLSNEQYWKTRHLKKLILNQVHPRGGETIPTRKRGMDAVVTTHRYDLNRHMFGDRNYKHEYYRLVSELSRIKITYNVGRNMGNSKIVLSQVDSDSDQKDHFLYLYWYPYTMTETYCIHYNMVSNCSTCEDSVKYSDPKSLLSC